MGLLIFGSRWIRRLGFVDIRFGGSCEYERWILRGFEGSFISHKRDFEFFFFFFSVTEILSPRLYKKRIRREREMQLAGKVRRHLRTVIFPDLINY